MKDLEREQANMRRRMARRRTAERRRVAVRRWSAARAVVKEERREFEVLHALYLFRDHKATYEDLRAVSAHRPFGRGWWLKTFGDLQDAGLLAFVTIMRREYVRLTKIGLSFVISNLSKSTEAHKL